MATNLFIPDNLRVGVFTTDGTFNQWRTGSRCIEIPVSANTTYYFRYQETSCNFAHVLLVSADGIATKYGDYGVITTASDTASLKISFADDVLLVASSLDYSGFVLSTDPFYDTMPVTPKVVLCGFYPLVTGNLVAKSDKYRSFGYICQPGHTYRVQNNGVDVPVFGLNQYDRSGNYLSRVVSSSSTTAAENAAVIGVVLETAQFEDLSGIRVVDAAGGTIDPEPFSYGNPYLTGSLKVGMAADANIVLPYQNAVAGKSYSLSLSLSGVGAAGLNSPVLATGAFASVGTVIFSLTGIPAVAGGLTATITGTDMPSPQILSINVADAGTIDPPSRSYHYIKVACKPETTYQFRYGGMHSTQAAFSYFNGTTFIRQESNLSVITTPAYCDTLGINLPDSAYPDHSKISLTEGTMGQFKSLSELTKDMSELKQSVGPVPYFDLNFYLFGDSITAANITRWVPTFMSLMTFKHIENFAVGGANYTCSANVVEDLSGLQQGPSNKIWNQLNRLKAKVAAGESPVPDVIVILAGINDRYSQLGDPEIAFDYTVDYSAITVTDPLTHNLAGAFRFTLEAILNEWPDVRIIIATPLPVGGSTREKLAADNATVEVITQTLTTCARKMGLQVINQAYECGISPYREVGEYLHYNSDGLHPNAHGGEKIGKYLARKLTEML